MLLPDGYEMRKLLEDQTDQTLQEYSRAIQAEIERRKDKSRESYERKLTVLFQHMKEEGFTPYVALPTGGYKPLFVENIEIYEKDD